MVRLSYLSILIFLSVLVFSIQTFATSDVTYLGICWLCKRPEPNIITEVCMKQGQITVPAMIVNNAVSNYIMQRADANTVYYFWNSAGFHCIRKTCCHCEEAQVDYYNWEDSHHITVLWKRGEHYKSAPCPDDLEPGKPVCLLSFLQANTF